jgi:hypothetical protein
MISSWIIILFCTWQISIHAHIHSSYDQKDLRSILIELFKRNKHRDYVSTDDDDNNDSLASIYDEQTVDSYDRVDIELWNRLNDEDIKHMPKTDDYSNEFQAMRWLKWYSRILERYHQVNIEFHVLPIIYLVFIVLDWRTFTMESSNEFNERKSASFDRTKSIGIAVPSTRITNSKGIPSFVDIFDE